MGHSRSVTPQQVTAYVVRGALGAIAGHSLLTAPGIAQIIPDGTLGTTVNPDATVRGLPASLIEGGLPQGGNLFHSFTDFNIGTGQAVYFANPLAIENILTRVTGGNLSTIDGLLGVDGAANLFLLNPNGVIFGPNAQLDISGSFRTSTASSIPFADGTLFNAVPLGGELLTVSVPLGVQFNSPPVGNLTNQGNLTVGAGQTLTLYGNTLLSSGNLAAPGGGVELIGNQVTLAPSPTGAIAVTADRLDLQVNGDLSFNTPLFMTTPGGAITASATNAITVNGAIVTTGGPVSLVGDADLNGVGPVSLTQPLITSGGNVFISGTSNSGTGIFTSNSGTIDSGGGAIALFGSSSGFDPTFSRGLELGGTLNSQGGTVTLNGSSFGAGGVVTFAPIATGGGGLFIGGSSLGTGTSVRGIELGNSVNTAGGTVTLNGSSSSGAGIFTSNSGTIDSGGGAIALFGSSSGFDPTFSRGLDLGGTLNSQGGTVTLNGSSFGAEGIVTFAPLTTGSGDLFIEGSSFGTGTFARGIALVSSVDTAGGTLSLTGSGANAGVSTFPGATLTAGTGDIILTADNPLLQAPISGTGGIQIQPLGTFTDITVGGSGDPNLTFLTQSELVQLTDGFSEIILGRGDGSGTLTLTGDVTLSDPATLLTGGTLDTTGATLSATDNANLTLQGATLNLGRINTLNTLDGAGDITLLSDNIISLTAPLNGTEAVLAAQGDVVLGDYTGSTLTINALGSIIANSLNTSSTSGDGGDITLTAGDDITLGFASTVAGFSGDAGGTSGDGGDITLTAGGNITVTDSTNTSAGFGGDAGDAGALTLTAGGDVTLGRTPTDEFDFLGSFSHLGRPQGTGTAGDVTITGRTVTLNGTIDPASLSPGGTSGNITLTATTGDIQLENGIIYGDTSFDLTGADQADTIFSTGGDITLNAAQDIRLSSFTLDSTYPGGGDRAGNTLLTAGRDINIDESSFVTTDSINGGIPGDITLTAPTGDIRVSGEITSTRTGSSESDTADGASTIQLTAPNGTVTLSGATLDSSTSGPGDGGAIAINTNTFTADGSQIQASTSGAGDGGFINLNANTFTTDGSTIQASASDAGDGGAIAINTNTFIADGSQIQASTSGAGDGGTIEIAAGPITLTDSSITTRAKINATGAGGDITLGGSTIALTGTTIDAGTSGTNDNPTDPNSRAALGGDIQLRSDGGITLATSRISANTEISGRGGTIDLRGGFLTLTDNSTLDVGVRGSGAGGSLTITTTGTNPNAENFGVLLDNSTIAALVEPSATAPSGAIAITTDSLGLRQGGRIQTQTRGGAAAGDVVLHVDRLLDIRGSNDRGFASGIAVSSETPTSGPGGSITLNPDNPRGTVAIADNGFLSALTRSVSNAGDIELNVENLILRSGGQIIAATFAPGAAGSIAVNATNQVLISGEGRAFGTFAAPFSGATTPRPLAFSNQADDNFTTFDGSAFAAQLNELGTGNFAYFSFQVTAPNSRGIFDIDNGTTFDVTDIDTELFLFDQRTGVLLATNDDANFDKVFDFPFIDDPDFFPDDPSFFPEDPDFFSDDPGFFSEDPDFFSDDPGFFSEDPGFFPEDPLVAADELDTAADPDFFASDFDPSVDPGSVTSFDSYLDYTFTTPGDYVIVVGQFDSFATDGPSLGGDRPQLGQTYDLRVSLQNAGPGRTNVPGENPNPNLDLRATPGQAPQFSSGLFAPTFGSGDGGSITINGPLTPVGDMLTTTAAPANLVRLDNASISVAATQGGRAGDIAINTRAFQLTDASISVSSPTGEAGNLSILSTSTAGSGFVLNNSELTAVTGRSPAAGTGGGIFITAADPVITLQGGSLISARANGSAQGGNVTLYAPNSFILSSALGNNDILATAAAGQGGRISITALRLYGFTLRTGSDNAGLRDNATNDISATAQDSAINGTVVLQTLIIDPSQDVLELPEDFSDRTNQITASCGLGAIADQSEFIITGRGGLPPNPNDLLSAPGVQVPWVMGDRAVPLEQVSPPAAAAPLIEAQGLVVDGNGVAHLVAEATATVSPAPSALSPPGGCAAAQPD